MPNRLPVLAKPERYEIFIHPNFEDFTFKGEETIELEILKPSKQLILHSAELKITSVKVIHKTQKQNGKLSYQEKDETATFIFSKSLPKGRVELKLSFTGELNDKMRGFYRSKFLHEGKEKYLATTQFEATDARRAFPSFDEPSHKAIFDLTLMVPKGMTAISNTVESEVKEDKSGFKIVKFETTPRMSTYLLAFMVGDFEHIEGKTKKGVLVRVFTTPGKSKHAHFALDTAIKVLEFYESYFNIPYPLPSMDLIAIPDFTSAAMENWGAVTYRESVILVDPEHTSTGNKQWIALVIAHELAHQWFGNLVTMEWWTHLWLNESFASFIEYFAIDHIFPEWDIWTRFIYQEHGAALKQDSLRNTHPVEVEVHHPKKIAEAFDAISYEKGAAILRMLSEYLGEEVFRQGLEHYLKKHSYSNAKTEDLWDSLSKVSGQDVASLMKEWTSRPGHPVVFVKEQGNDLKLTQQRFISTQAANKDSTEWVIPINVLRGKAVIKYLMLGKSLTISKPREGRGLKLNHEDASFIRVAYPKKYLELFREAISKGELSVVDRLSVIRDSFDLSEPGLASTSDALVLTKSFINEGDYTVWLEISSHLSELDNLYAKEGFYEDYKGFARSIYKKIGGKMGWGKKAGESHTDPMLRSLVLYSLGSYGDKEVIKKARELFKKGNIEADLKGVVYNLVAENAGVEEFELFLKMYRATDQQQERNRIDKALASFKDEKLLMKALEFALSDDVRSQDSLHNIIYVMQNPKGRRLAWEFIKENWSKLYERYSGGHSLSRLVASLGSFSDKEMVSEIDKFFKSHPTLEAKRAIEQAKEKITSNYEWLKRDKEKVAALLGVLNG